MDSKRVLAVALGLLLAILLGLVGLFVWLSGGQSESADEEVAPTQGLVHVKTIYTGDGENLRRPVGIAADSRGNFFVTLRDVQRVMEFDRSGKWVRSWGERGVEQGQLVAPTGVAVDRTADHVYIVDRARLRLIAYSGDGKFLWEVPVLNPVSVATRPGGVVVGTFGPLAVMNAQGELDREVGSRGPEPGQFDYPRGVVAVEGDQVIVADTNNARMQRVALSGEATAKVEWIDGAPPKVQDDPDTRYGVPSGVATDERGNAYVLDGFRHKIVVLGAKDGSEVHVFDNIEGEADGKFRLPTGIAYLGGDTFAITDTYHDRVQIVRLLLPARDNVVNRNPWLWWIALALLVFALATLVGRKRWYATSGALEAARDRRQLRLVVAVARKLGVLPAALAAMDGLEEEGVVIGDYLFAVDSPESGPGDSRAITAAARPTGWRRLLMPRVRIVVADQAEAAEVRAAGGKHPVTLDELAANFSIGDGPTQEGGSSEPS